jgi:hypothetical protein
LAEIEACSFQKKCFNESKTSKSKTMEMIDFDEIARLTGFSVGKIKWLLGELDVQCLAMTPAGAKAIYQTAPPDSELEYAAASRWNELCLRKLKTARSLAQIIAVFNTTPHGSSSEKAALNRWIACANDQLDLADVLKSADELPEYIVARVVRKMASVGSIF